MYEGSDHGGAADFKVGVQNMICERSERKKNFVPPLFQMWVTNKQISVEAYSIYCNLLSVEGFSSSPSFVAGREIVGAWKTSASSAEYMESAR